jgi:hypothetical protein
MEAGQQLLHYRLIEKIGEGGMGVVWKARDTHLDRDVAIKILPANFAGDAERLARFEREAKLLAQMSHPNIASVHGLDQDKGVRFLVMELVAGEDLARRLHHGPVPVEEALRVGLQVCEALEAAHENGVIHRDLKPANIQLTPTGDVKVLDFGLAKAFDMAGPSSDASISPTVTSAGTMAGTILGTAAYMSPEQAHGRPVDRRADIWAFGCVLYELLTGKLAFQGESVSDTLASVLKFEPDHASLPSEVPRRVRRLLVRCLAKHPKQRLQAIGEARIALEECIAGTAEDVADPTMAPARKKTGGLRVWTLVAALAVGLATGGLAVWNMRPAATRTITRFPVDLAGRLSNGQPQTFADPGSRQETLDRIQRDCLRQYPPELLARMASGVREIPEEVDADPEAQMQFLDKEIPLDKGLFYPILLEDMLPALERYVSPGVRFLDLGSGDGRVVFLANVLGADAVGIEFDKQLVRISRRAGKSLKGLVDPKRLKIVKGDFFASPWSGYDVIFFFDSSSFEPERVRRKLEREMDPGAVLVVGFEQAPFPGLELVERNRPHHPKITVYRQPGNHRP